MAVATDRRNLRIYSVGGMQREVLTLPGPVVALSGFKNKIMASVHLAMPLPGNQSIGKKHALKKYVQFALNTSCFWGK